MFKQIVHPIYRISQLNVLYRMVSKKLAQYTALLHMHWFNDSVIITKLQGTKSLVCDVLTKGSILPM